MTKDPRTSPNLVPIRNGLGLHIALVSPPLGPTRSIPPGLGAWGVACHPAPSQEAHSFPDLHTLPDHGRDESKPNTIIRSRRERGAERAKLYIRHAAVIPGHPVTPSPGGLLMYPYMSVRVSVCVRVCVCNGWKQVDRGGTLSRSRTCTDNVIFTWVSSSFLHRRAFVNAA